MPDNGNSNNIENGFAFGQLISTLRLGMLEWDLEAGVSVCNDVWKELTGFDSIPDGIYDRGNSVYNQDMDAVIDNVSRCLSGAVSFYEVDYRIVRGDGSIIWIQEKGAVTKRDDEGKPLKLTAVLNEETRLKDTMTQDRLLSASNAAVSVLLEVSHEDFNAALVTALGILGEAVRVDRAYIWKNSVVDEKLCCTQTAEWARAKSSNHERVPAVCLPYDDFIPGWQELMQSTTQLNGPVSGLGEDFIDFPGMEDVRSILILPIMIRDEFWGFMGFDDCRTERFFEKIEVDIMRSGGIMIAAAVGRNDMTENLIKAKEAALASTNAKSEFLSRMSHEIRTPMNAIIGMTTIARKTIEFNKIQQCLEKVDVSSRQLLSIINDILDMSKIEANKFEIASHEFDFEKMVQNVLNVVQVKVDEKHQNFTCIFDSLFTRNVISDELRLSQVMINLVNNAVKFTQQGGNITLKITQTPKGEDISGLRVEVADNGIGITPEQKKRLFSSFEQAEIGTTRKFGGTGLGLAICKKIVNLMGGDIWVESEEGCGSRFIFEVDIGWGETRPSQKKSSRRKKDPKILVVDDAEDVLDYFKNILRSFALDCDTASSGQQAIAMSMKMKADGVAPYDLVFMDWNMPVMDGGITARELKKINESLVVVMISVADWADIEKDVRQYGVTNFLAKPVLPSALYNTVVELTENTLVQESLPGTAAACDWVGKRILLVEDIEINREIIMSVLEETGVMIDCAENGLIAVEAFADHYDDYDVILMDIQMPELDGLEATRRIRRLNVKNAVTVPIIAMTANAFNEDVEKCLNAGMNGHVAKPIEFDVLLQTLSGYLNK